MVKQYVGARYVPKFYKNSQNPLSNDWEANVTYEALTVVTYLSDSYTSKKPVPVTVGNPRDNSEYWALTGAYNAQIEQYREDVEGYKSEIGDLENLETPDKSSIVNAINSIGDIEDNYPDNRPDNIVTKYGAYNDGTHAADTLRAIEDCISDNGGAFIPKGVYTLNNTLVIPNGAYLIGEVEGFGDNQVINTTSGFEVVGSRHVIKNLKLVSTDQTGTALYLHGTNPGGGTSNEYVTECIFENLTLNNFEYGIRLNGTIWDNRLDNIRINFANHAIYKEAQIYGMFNCQFNNVYCSGSKVDNLVLHRAQNVEFNSCNFGFSTHSAILIFKDCYGGINFNSCNFECDKKIENLHSYDALIVVCENTTFNCCSFSLNAEAGTAFINIGDNELTGMIFTNCQYQKTGGTSDSNEFFSTECITPQGDYGCIIMDLSNKGFPMIVPSMPNALKGYFRQESYSIIPCIYDRTTADTNKMKIGAVYFEVSTNYLVLKRGSTTITQLYPPAT